MLEKFQKILEDLKKKQSKELLPTTVKTVEGYFNMEEWNKWLKFNAMTPEQLRRVEAFENNLKKVFAKLYVPEAHSLIDT